ncbi:Putative Holliday junction resolvase [Corynebacterium kalinowskii]|uniref:Putative pre-16S rRNA nuclease n=1 Tax=Corynebacterium kalinowskii TaxID=2675216 RepID=A0A6B8VGI3_9CORY|nr:Holliday junction resolvase RuvX [Corynebacterium kalinowskii]QGU02119.1 Putative Holliday junction resolvase [Corynebacterium kalinowskii]
MVKPDIPGHDDPGHGRRLALDVGTVRIGVAYSNREATLAMPLETIPRKTGLKDRDQEDIERILELLDEHEVVEVVVGLPRDLKGQGSSSVKHAKEIAFRIRRRSDVIVRMGDERLTTVAALGAVHAAGKTEKQTRAIIDQVAAVEILQSWLDARQRYLERAES